MTTPVASSAVIDLRIRDLSQLFDSLDPSPFHARGLDTEASTYIIDCAGEFAPSTPLTLVIHAPEALRARISETADAVHSHFRYLHTQLTRRQTRRIRSGRIALTFGLMVMMACQAIRVLLNEWSEHAFAQGIGEGLLVLGWVALWRPAELLIFERRETRLERDLLLRLSTIPVQFIKRDADLRE